MASTLTQPVATEQTAGNIVSGSGLSLIKSVASLLTPASTLISGSSAGCVDRGYAYSGIVAAGTPFTINLSSGNDQLGNVMAMVHVGRVHVVHQGATGKLTVGAGTHPVLGSDLDTLQPGGSTVKHNAGAGYRVSTGSVSGVNQIEAIPVVDTTGSGTFTLAIMGITTGAITYSSTAATLVSNINTALDAAFGAGNIVASGATLSALVLTFTANGYAANPFVGHVVPVITGSGFTINGSSASNPSTTTTAGVEAQSQSDTLTITASAGAIPFSIIILGRSA